jgi:glycosyltransferase involved in cell wall biosynthesis
MLYKKDDIIFSIIVSVYNREKYIRECINSLLNQDFRNFEVVVIDDGSTDRTGEILKSFTDPKLKYFYKSHTRCWDSKNMGLDKATGKFVIYVDSDDYLSSNYLKESFRLISTYKNYDYYYPEKLYIVEEDGTVTNSIWRYIDYPEDERRKLVFLYMNHTIGGIPHTGAIVKKEVFEQHGQFDGNLYNFGDTDYIVRRADKIKFKQLPELRYYYKRHHESQICKDYTYRNQTTANLVEFCYRNYPSDFYVPQDSDFSSGEDFVVKKLMHLSQTAPPPKEPFLNKAKEFIKLTRTNS